MPKKEPGDSPRFLFPIVKGSAIPVVLMFFAVSPRVTFWTVSAKRYTGRHSEEHSNDGNCRSFDYRKKKTRRIARFFFRHLHIKNSKPTFVEKEVSESQLASKRRTLLVKTYLIQKKFQFIINFFCVYL